MQGNNSIVIKVKASFLPVNYQKILSPVMKKNSFKSLFFYLALFIVIIITTSFTKKLNRVISDKKNYDTVIVYRSPELPKQMNFAGESVPLERWEIKEQLEREFILISHQTGTMLYIMKLSGRWFPLIEERLKANGIPSDFKYLCVAESNLQNLISKSLAVGFWQFMSYTAPGYNLEINKDVDERYNVLKATEAACKYLKQAYAKFGSWTAAAASYNCGQGAYTRHADFQQTKNFYDLDIRDETNKYIFRILTFKHLMENKEKYGYIISPEDFYQPLKTKTIQVSATIPDLAQFAIDNGTTYKMLRILNPWIRGKSLVAGAGKKYNVLLPEDK